MTEAVNPKNERRLTTNEKRKMDLDDRTLPNYGKNINLDNSEDAFDFTEPTFDGLDKGLGVVDRYVLKERLGAGGFGSVYLAEDTEAKILVALKVLPSILSVIPEEMDRVRDNFALVSQLSHPNIAGLKYLHKIQSIDSDARSALEVSVGGYLVVMEYVKGCTLSAWKKSQGGKLPFEHSVEICSKVAAALDYAHGHRIIHRDIKPGNIMVTFDREDLIKEVKVLDFGLAAEIRSSMTRVSKEQGDTSGTRPYMAPEQWSGAKQGHFTDQYSLAVMFYELVSGEVPFQSAFETGDPVIMLNVAENKIPEAIESLSKKQNAVLLRALSKEPNERFASCSDFVGALGGGKVRRSQPLKTRKNTKGIRFFVAACVVGALAFGGYKGYENHLEKSKVVEQQKQLDAEKQAKVDELTAKIERALSTGDLQSAGSGIAELETLAGIAVAASLKSRYESKAGEREVNQRSAQAEVAHKNANKLKNSEGFDKKLEALEIDWLTAENARQGKTWGQALSGYDSVIEKCRELEKLDVARTAAGNARSGCDIAKSEAESANAEHDAKKLWDEAVKLEQQAISAFSNGALSADGFVNAKQNWEDAAKKYQISRSYALSVQEYRKQKQKYESAVASDILLLKTHGDKKWDVVSAAAKVGERSGNDPVEGAKAYEKALAGLAAAVTEAKSLKAEAELKARIALVEGALSRAKTALADENWQGVVDILSNVDTGSSEVGSGSGRLTKEKDDLLKKANENLIPSMRFVAYADGKEVNATLKQGSKEWTTPITLNMKEDGDYSFSVEYNVGKRRYTTDNFSVSASWKGLKEKTLTLKEIRDPTIGNSLGMEFVEVAAGSFTMGSSMSEREECVRQGGKMSYYEDETQHKVTLTKPFWIGKHEVTQKQYEQIMGNNPSRFKGSDNPVEQVSWNDAMEFCRKLTETEQKAGRLPPGYKYTLPTEAQWEFAARGGNKSKGYKYSGSDNLDSVGWYYENSGDKRLDDSSWSVDKLKSNNCQTYPVGQKNPNELGLYDMSGNVWEWCSDWYDSDYYDGGSMTDPKGASTGSRRVYRGGGWGSSAGVCRSADRGSRTPTSTSYDLGFRLCLVPR